MRKQWIAKAAMLCVTVGMSVALPQYVMGAETATQVSQEEVVSSEKERVEDETYNVNSLGFYDGELMNIGGRWCYVENGQIDRSFTGESWYNDRYYFVRKGYVDWNFTGAWQDGRFYYCFINGAESDTFTGLMPYKGCYTGSTYSKMKVYFENGHMANPVYTGLYCQDGTWYYVDRGIVNGTDNRFTYYNGTTYYVKNSVIDWNYSGFEWYGDNLTCVKNGAIGTG